MYKKNPPFQECAGLILGEKLLQVDAKL
ncbi:hypothetical protein OIU77_002449, partial [Salix suchowensis]